ASIRIYLSGDQVTGYMRTIEVPEEWGRDWNERQSGKTPFKVAAGLVGAVLVILAIVGLFGPSTGRKFSFTAALPIVLLVLAGSIGSVALVPDSITAQLDPTQDWKMQMGILIF